MVGEVIESQALARSGGASPLPVYSGKQMQEAFGAYKELQVALDKAMPDAIMELDGKKFRKKAYWRGVAVAFNLTVEVVEERRVVSGHFHDGRENFGYIVTKRATAPNGRTVVSDGTCFAVEKARRFKCQHPHPTWKGKTLHFPHATCPDFDPEFQWRTLSGDATEHNVRGHASTRAFNRAVSDLVGFGEVSAEEIDRDDEHGEHGQGQATTAPAAGGSASASAPATGQPRQPAAASSVAPTSTTPGSGPTTVVLVETKTGANARGPWKRYLVSFADGRKGSTFSESLGVTAEAAEKAKTPVDPELVKTDKGHDLKALRPVAPPEPVHVDEPVAGPEKVLTVRPLETDHGTRYVIQTDKRQLVTDQKAFADSCTAARAAKLGVTPTFEVRTSAAGSINKLTGLVVEDPDDGPSESESAFATLAASVETREPGQEG